MALKRIVMHWSAGSHRASASDKKHYHEIVEGDGNRVEGDKLPEANNSTSDGHYAAHIKGFNTGSIGLAMAAMAGAQHSPFSAGSHPITPVQLEAFTQMVAEYADTYGFDVNRKTVFTHCEAPITHDKPQSGKWDITWLPGMVKPGDPIAIGDRLREMVQAKLDQLRGEAAPVMASAEEDDFAIKLAAHISEFIKEYRA